MKPFRLVTLCVLVFFSPFISGCLTDPERFSLPASDQELAADPDISAALPANPHLKSIGFHGKLSELHLQQNESYPLFLSVTLDDGQTYKGITKSFQPQDDDLKGTVVWYSNNSEIAVVSPSGKLYAVSAGSTTILASLNGKTIYLTVHVEEKQTESTLSDSVQIQDEDFDGSDLSLEQDQDAVDNVEEENSDQKDIGENEIMPDEPKDVMDAFLDSADVLTDNFGVDSGFGYEDFPDVVFGPPGGSLDVVSFGTDGELLIELNDFVIVNGDGADFTIFENPFPGWLECAEVEVSEDGLTFQNFNCQSVDANAKYSGCAGVHSVVEGLEAEDYLDSSLSGGDVFDLDDLPSPISIVRFVRIRHVGFCTTTESEDPLIGSGTSGGFDFDAMAILNGIYD